MEPIGYHVSLRLEEDRQIAVTPQQRRELARAILDVARAFELLAFRWADTHGHLLAMGDRATCAELVRRVEIAIQRRFAPGLPFARPRFRPVYSLWHLSEAFFYVLRQDKRHDLGNDPHRDASNLPDLLGARTRGVWTTVPVRANLARVGRDDLLEVAGWNQLGAGGIEHLEDAVVNAASLPALEGRSAEVAAARRAAIDAIAAPTVALAEALRVTPQAIRKMRKHESHAPLVRAIELQLGIRSRVLPDRLLAQPTVGSSPSRARWLRRAALAATRRGRWDLHWLGCGIEQPHR